MRKKHKLSLAAEGDYAKILAHIAEDNPAAAKEVKAGFEEAFRKLAQYPHMGQKRADMTSKPVRFWNVYSYSVIYDPESTPLMVARIISNYRDIEALLNA